MTLSVTANFVFSLCRKATDEAWTCSSQPSDASLTIDVRSPLPSGGHLLQSPSSSGCYSLGQLFNDVSGGVHSAYTKLSIGGASC